MRGRSATATVPAIQWGDGVIVVKDFALVNGIAGRFGPKGRSATPDETLTVNLKDVDLGIVDAFLLRPQQLCGQRSTRRPSSAARPDAPAAEADFTIVNGKFRDSAVRSPSPAR